MKLRWLNFPFQPNINVETTLNQRNSINVVSTLFCQRWNYVDKHTSAQLSFSTIFQRWNNVDSSALNRRNSINVVSTLFCHRWNNVDKCTSVQLSFSTKYQRWCVCWAIHWNKAKMLKKYPWDKINVKKIPFLFFRKLQLIIVLLLICDSYMS